MKAIGAASSSKGGDEGGVSQEDLEKQNTEIQRLNLLVKQRDNEIGILLNYLNKQKEAGESADVAVEGRPVVYENQNNTTVASSNYGEEIKYDPDMQKQSPTQPTLFQMMKGNGG